MINQRPLDSDRMRAVQSPVIPVVGELIVNNPGTISLGQGVVYYGPPPEAINQLASFLGDARNHQYKAVDGVPALIGAVEEKLRRENNVEVGADSRVVVTAGSNLAFMNAVLAITDPGDEIILQTPYYFNQEMAVTMASCRAVLVPTDENYQLRVGAVRDAVSARTRAVVTVSPNNPTGAVYSPESLREVNALCRDRNIYHISDEAYEYFTYEPTRHFSPASIDKSQAHTISLYSLSKSYGFASWRIGYMVIPVHLHASFCKIQDTLLICPPVVSQYAALGALQAGAAYCRDRIRPLAEVREEVQRQLRRLEPACVVPSPDGAFYFFAKINAGLSSMALVERLIREHGVAVMPGAAFGMRDEKDGCYLRIAYGALRKETAIEGLARLTGGLETILGRATE